MRIPSKGEIIRTDTHQGEIVILPSDSVRLNDVIRGPNLAPSVKGGARTLPCQDDDCAENGSARERLLDALRNLVDTDPLFASRSGFHHP